MRDISGVQSRLAGVTGKPWKYNPKHEMFVGTTNAINTYYDILDLGRDGKEYYAYKDESGSGYRLSDASKKRMARIKAMGEFLENCREDIAFLLEHVKSLIERTSELTEALAPFANREAEHQHGGKYSALTDSQWRRAIETYQQCPGGDMCGCEPGSCKR